MTTVTTVMTVTASQRTVKWPSRQAGRQADGSQPSSSGEWLKTGASTFPDSDWPSFRNTVHSLGLSIRLSLSLFALVVEQASKQIK